MSTGAKVFVPLGNYPLYKYNCKKPHGLLYNLGFQMSLCINMILTIKVSGRVVLTETLLSSIYHKTWNK